MAQANIKDRIKEMRLRVLAEPSVEVAAEMDGKQLPEDNIEIPEIHQETYASVIDKTTKTETVQIPKSDKKKASKKFKKQESKKAAEILEKTPQQEFNANTTERVEEIQNEHAQEQIDKQPEEEIEKYHINLQTEAKETSEITELIANDKAQDEHKKPSTEIIELTDKWVELEVRSRLSGLEKQEKQTRAMLKEIVEILDRIETSEHSERALPAVTAKKLVPPSPTSQISENKKRHWEDIIKRIFVVMGTFAIFAGVIWGILLYLFFNI